MGRILWDSFRTLGYRMLVILAYMVALALLAAPLGLILPVWARPFAGLAAWLGGTAYVTSRFEKTIGGWAIILALAPAFMSAYSLADLVAPLAGERVSGISATDAPLHPSAQGFDFSDSVVQTDYAASYRHSMRDSKSGRITYRYYNIAPLTAAGWTPDQPVPAWAGCSEEYTRTCDEWDDAGLRGGVAIEQGDRDQLRQAVDQALSTHGLREAPGAPLLSRVASVDAGITERALIVPLVLLMAYLVWLVPAAFLALLDTGAQLWDHWRR
ncbi:MAG: hypothetical protein OHK0022_11100 [Roseiflexaceae bacterium]